MANTCLFLSSPIKLCHFESHLTKLQADSNYLLSEEFEVNDALSVGAGQLDQNTAAFRFIHESPVI